MGDLGPYWGPTGARRSEWMPWSAEMMCSWWGVRGTGTLDSTCRRFGFVPSLDRALSPKVPLLFLTFLFLSAQSNLEPPAPNVGNFTLCMHSGTSSGCIRIHLKNLGDWGLRDGRRTFLKSTRSPEVEAALLKFSRESERWPFAFHCRLLTALSTLLNIPLFSLLEIKTLKLSFLFFRRRFSRAVV